MPLLSSIVATSIPTTLLQCFCSLDGSYETNVEQFFAYTRERRARTKAHLALLKSIDDGDNDGDNDINNIHDYMNLCLKTRKKRCAVPWKQHVDDMTVALPPNQSSWYQLYVTNKCLLTNDKSRFEFRRRFRLPFESYLELVERCKEHGKYEGDCFYRWCGVDKTNRKKSSPIELLVLGALRYLGRGWTFDDICESTCISTETHRCFLNAFLEFGSTILYSKYVVTPRTLEDAQSHMVEFDKAGFPGCVGSCDCTHIATEKCQYNLKNNHTGRNKKTTTRTFNLTANHRRRILHTTRGGPGRWNDQTMVTYDTFITGMHEGTALSEVCFQLYEYNEEGDVFLRDYTGAYVIVDNGYLDWSVTVPPFSRTNNLREIRWSRWVESMRKDVECTFGILKGRWRVLKCGIRVHGVDKVDLIWLTCCALHNWLLEIDGLNEAWTGEQVADSTAESDWLGELGDHDFDDISRDSVPNAILRLSNNLTVRNFDSSGMGPGSDVADESINLFEMAAPSETVDDDCEEEQNAGSARVVKNMSLTKFRRKLVEHFHIMWSRNKIVWPSAKSRIDTNRDHL